MKDYTQLKLLLESLESFPLQFTYKFIGRNTANFRTAVTQFEALFPSLKTEGSRLSGNQAHLSMTYSLSAPTAQHIIDVFQAIEKIEDVLIVL